MNKLCKLLLAALIGLAWSSGCMATYATFDYHDAFIAGIVLSVVSATLVAVALIEAAKEE